MKKLTRANVLLTVISILFSLAVLEVGARIVYKHRFTLIDSNKAGVLNVPDPVLSYRACQNGTGVDEGYLNGQLQYKVTYHTNEFGRRVVPCADAASRPNFIALFGCSFTYGVAVEDNETLPAYLAQLAPGYAPYNFAYQGWGAQHVLLTMREPLEKEISQKSGIGIYVYIAGHTRRLVGRANVLAGWGADFPYFSLEGDKLVQNGTFATARPAWVWFSRLMYHSRLVRIGLEWLPEYSPYKLELTARVIAAARDEFEQRFPGSPFYVAFPYCVRKPHIHDALMPYLEKYHIRVLRGDLARDPSADVESLWVGGHHPSPLGNKKMAEYLVKELGLGGAAANS